MPKRVIDFDAMWASDKIAACAEWAQTEYAWLYGLADCAGCFELTNLRVIWGRVAAIRRNFSFERLQQVLDEFQDKGLLFVWNENGKRYGHWTGSDVPGRLPPPSWRNRLERLAPPLPQEPFVKYVASHSAGVKNKLRCESMPDGTSAACGGELHSATDGPEQRTIEPSAEMTRVEPVGVWRDERALNCSSAESTPSRFPRRANVRRSSKECESLRGGFLKACLEEPQAQDLDLDQEGKGNSDNHTHTGVDEKSVSDRSQKLFQEKQKPFEEKANTQPRVEKTAADTGQSLRTIDNSTPYAIASPETLRGIWEQERGSLPEVRALSPERLARCRERISHALNKFGNASQFLADFREAVTRAAATPFLCGAGPAGWRANFDWLIANNTNYLKVLEGRYDAGARNLASANAVPAGASSGAAAPSWASHVNARDEAVRRELNAGTGPSARPSAIRVRAGILERVFNR